MFNMPVGLVANIVGVRSLADTVLMVGYEFCQLHQLHSLHSANVGLRYRRAREPVEEMRSRVAEPAHQGRECCAAGAARPNQGEPDARALNHRPETACSL
jgi:hypothetical protein